MRQPEFQVRLATVREAVQVARMSRDLIEAGLAWAWRPERVAASVRHPDANVVVALDEGDVAGFGIMRYGHDEAHLDLCGVAPAYRRLGLGRRLVAWLEAPAVVGGIAAVALEVRAGNIGAQRFYERIGYREIARAEGYYQGRETAVRMRHVLAHQSHNVD